MSPQSEVVSVVSQMAFLDRVVIIWRSIVLHPLVLLALPAGIIVLETDVLSQLFKSKMLGWLPFNALTRAALYCLVLPWLFHAHRVLRRRALNPSAKMIVQWPQEVVLVTGGSSGIGANLVQKLEGLGATVAIMDIVPPGFEVADRTTFFETDIANYGKVKASYDSIVAKMGHPTMLVANAGYVQGRTLIDASPEAITRTFGVNVLGVVYPIKLVIPQMLAANRGHILMTSSTTAYSAVPCSVADYAASKAAVAQMMQGLQTELKHKHGNPAVKVSAIFPHTIATDMFAGIDKLANPAILPILQPADVANRMLQILSKGESDVVLMPAGAIIFKIARVCPEWIRVALQDMASGFMNHLAAARRHEEPGEMA